MIYQTTAELREAYRQRTAAGFDNYTLVTGEVGMWKSLWARKWGRYLDPSLSVGNIHFTQDAYLDDAVNLQKGRSIIMDEFRAHKRLAMHGHRMELLDFNKETRQLGLNPIFCYPDAEELDKDLMKRFEWWHSKPNRGLVVVRRRIGFDAFNMKAEPFTVTKWPIVARFPVTGANDPLRTEYEMKKEARMRDRAAKLRENYGGEREPIQAMAPEPSSRVPTAFLDMVLGDLKRP